METKDKLPPIPTPASQRWREFRIQVLPIVVFITVITGIVYLWKNFVLPVGIVGLAQTNTVNITCTVDGLIAQLLVQPFQTVTQGQVIAIVQGSETDLFQAEGESDIADLEVMRDRIRVGVDRAEQGVERYRVELMLQRIDLANDRAQLFAVSNEFVRLDKGVKEKFEPQALADIAKANFDALLASINERSSAIADLAKTSSEMQKRLVTTNDITSIDRAIEMKRKTMEELMKPSTLRSPIDGQVSFVLHYPGEKIIRGTAVASIASPISTNIIAYIRQPITVRPNTNEPVVIITRTQPRKVLNGKITRVGAQLEAISPSLISVDANRFEWGLPVLVEVPPGYDLIPGEFVTLSIGATTR